MPDINSIPASPHATATATRRALSSQQMPPPPVPTSPALVNVLPSNQPVVTNTGAQPTVVSPYFLPPNILTGAAMGDNTGVGPGPGPVRHPRPLTAADLHLQLEKEQEAVVNRLTRELSLLRAAQNASVVSNASSTSASGTESAQLGDTLHAGSGPGLAHHRTSRHHRTSSNTSSRSIAANAGSVSTTSLAGISSPAPVRPSQAVLSGISLSRQGSSASRRSRAASPSPAAMNIPGYGNQSQTPSNPPSYTHSHLNDPGMATYFANRATPTSNTSAPVFTPGSSATELSPAILPATTRYEETAFYRSELDNVKKENDALKRRVRELERMVRDRRPSDASRASQTPSIGAAGRARSDSASTTASVSVAASTTGAGGVSIAAQREGSQRPRVVSMLSASGSVAVGVPEDEVRVGESAASAGLGGQEQGSSQA